MNRLLAAAVILTSLATLAAAQDINGAVDPSLKLQQSDATKRQAALRATLTAMNDGNETGELVVGYLQREGITVDFATQQETAEIRQSGPHGERTLYLSDKLPLYPRVLGAAIAVETADKMYGGMEISRESGYMKDSVVARVWLELGGERAKLPVIEPLTGYTNGRLAAPIQRWVDNSETAPSIAEQLKDVASCLASQNYHVIPSCMERKDKLEKDARAYNGFHENELQWFMLHQGI